MTQGVENMTTGIAFFVARFVNGAAKYTVPTTISADSAETIRCFVESFSFLLNRPGYTGQAVPLVALADLADAYSTHPRTQYCTALIREICC